ncbi:MAG: apolipoprotein N-acyltransferase, partial [Planctomycetota bacterium]|nr:apolipoprotein N-acyltransferase [Planctomycetota bacterium]
MIAPVERKPDTPPPDAPVPGTLRYRAGTILIAALMLAWVGAFTPTPQVLCTLPGIVGWLLLVERCRTLRGALGWTFLFGALAIGYGYRWLAQTTQDFGNLPPVASWVLTALFGALGILHGWIFVIVHRGMLARGRRPHPLTTVLLIVGAEQLPIRLFPWKVGHGAVDVPPLVQAAEWGGVSAVSFVLLCLVVPVHEWIRWAFGRLGPPARPKAAFVTFAIGCVLFGWGQWRYGQVQAEEDVATKSISVGIVQANVGRHAKERDPRQRQANLEAYRRGSEQAAREGAELIVWPETAIASSIRMMEPTHRPHVTNGDINRMGYRFLTELGKDHAFLVGAYERKQGRAKITAGEKFDERYNVAALREPGGLDAPWTVYRKVYLIPFGEHIPPPLNSVLDERKYLPQKFKMRPGSMEGEARRYSSMLEYKGLKMAPFLCYEGILPDHVRAVTDGTRPDLLVSLTNDSWFGDTWEPYQHLNFTRFRAVEHRVPLIRATNTGISAFVSMTGDIKAENRLGLFEEGVMVRDVKLVERSPTIYVRFGHAFPWLCAVLALLIFIGALMRPPPVIE